MTSKRRLSQSLSPKHSDGYKTETEIDGDAGEIQIDGVGHETQIDGVGHETQIDGVGHETQIDGDGHETQIDGDGTESQIDGDTNETRTEDSSKTLVCRICGDRARFINYGALSCQSCKTFFRRNGFRPESVRPCILSNSCEVNMQTRPNCASCRVAKCLRMGMSPELIRKEDFKKSKSSPSPKSKSTKQLTTASRLPTLDLLQGDRSLLIDSDWILLSNIVHAHDEYSTAAQLCQTIDSLSTLPIEVHSNMIDPFEIVSQMYRSMQSFISSSPDFRVLTLNEQTSLFERNLHGITGFYSTLFFRNTNILYNDIYMNAFSAIYGPEMMLLEKNANERLDPDLTLIKLLLLILAFSSNCFIVDIRENRERDSLLSGTFRLFGSQNVYVELLWKYMVYHYGDRETVLRFSRLLQIILCKLKTLATVHMNNEVHRNMVDGIIERTKRSLSITDNDHTPLWRKN